LGKMKYQNKNKIKRNIFKNKRIKTLRTAIIRMDKCPINAD